MARFNEISIHKLSYRIDEALKEGTRYGDSDCLGMICSDGSLLRKGDGFGPGRMFKRTSSSPTSDRHHRRISRSSAQTLP